MQIHSVTREMFEVPGQGEPSPGTRGNYHKHSLTWVTRI